MIDFNPVTRFQLLAIGDLAVLTSGGDMVGTVVTIGRGILIDTRGAGPCLILIQVPDADKVVVPNSGCIFNRFGGCIAVVHPDAVTVRVCADLRYAYPNRRIAGFVPLLDFVIQGCAVSGKEAQVRAVVVGLAVIDVARIQNDQHRKIGQGFRLRKIIKSQLLTTGPVAVPPVDIQHAIGVDRVVISSSHRVDIGHRDGDQLSISTTVAIVGHNLYFVDAIGIGVGGVFKIRCTVESQFAAVGVDAEPVAIGTTAEAVGNGIAIHIGCRDGSDKRLVLGGVGTGGIASSI